MMSSKRWSLISRTEVWDNLQFWNIFKRIFHHFASRREWFNSSKFKFVQGLEFSAGLSLSRIDKSKQRTTIF